ncbi:hypothetical protein A2875_04805 [Candidatus Gottesmanbacteria bacterium RIFCSPHIGHO2_01_FULL_46_14]|uniref:Transposase IS200-like domain-containing protein n=1 Tax=Candidatus Gottesmanbacteria bacterium RIFCSPHIGHO2_01_FULL_46_14 TaxID=1798380 RepID=A0A1F5ZMS0_9BACT|nr:MAG: hypothetical protein A2875_04805 [Candidatus Gottesmanbacteria bacterium RIFCSPHIGHO2_01_FULL_46_14]
MRQLQFVSGEYYHIYNRGVDKRKIFLRFGHYRRFLSTTKRILDAGSATQKLKQNQGLALKSKVEIISYCLMPNHYHFLILQKENFGITQFMHRLNTSYTMYFNLNQKRTGRLFQYTFKARHIDNENAFLHVGRYIHLNPLISGLVDSIDLWPWSSYLGTIGKRTDELCHPERILSYFHTSTPEMSYQKFVNDQAAYAQLLHTAQKAEDEDALYL